MGMLGLMNVLSLEGASHNIKVNCLAPGAATRMTATVPGRPKVDIDNPPPERSPALVSPGVLFMCSEDAPTGKVIQGSGGRFSVSAVFSNDGADLGVDASYEKFLENSDKILDMSKAQEGSAMRRRRQT